MIEEYWSRMVKISIKEMKKLCDGINDFLRKDNKSFYLKIAYEEVLFSVVFTEKKNTMAFYMKVSQILIKSFSFGKLRL